MKTTTYATTGTYAIPTHPFPKMGVDTANVKYLNTNYETSWSFDIVEDPDRFAHRFIMELWVFGTSVFKRRMYRSEQVVDRSIPMSIAEQDVRQRMASDLAGKALLDLNCNMFEPYKPKPKKLQLELIDL
jgi:hypothetical protein